MTIPLTWFQIDERLHPQDGNGWSVAAARFWGVGKRPEDGRVSISNWHRGKRRLPSDRLVEWKGLAAAHGFDLSLALTLQESSKRVGG